MKVYFDNATTTPMLPEVIETIYQSMKTTFGNPSSTHSFGRKSRTLVETVRRNIAKYFNAAPNEIVFTAGGSEADNMILQNAVVHLGVKTIVSSRVEHPAILHTLAVLEKDFDLSVKHVKFTTDGGIDYTDLALLLKESADKTLVSLMHVNNETGRLLDLQKVSDLCQEYHAYFHSDTVQSVGKFRIDLEQTPLDFFAASAHKFHGPKGVGFAYFKKGTAIKPLLHGGGQERGARAGTENIHSIIGMEKALQLAYDNLEKDRDYIQELKSYFILVLQKSFPKIRFNAASDDARKSSYIILNARFPKEISMLLFHLDIKGIAVSGGSACQSGSNKGSHVLNSILSVEDTTKSSLRFSFSKLNTKEEIDFVVHHLTQIIK